MSEVLHVTKLYHPYVGGTEVYIKRLAEGLVDKGYDCTVLTSNALFDGLGHPVHNRNKDTNYCERGESELNGVRVKRVPYCFGESYLTERTEQAINFLLKKISYPISPVLSGIFNDPAGWKLFVKGTKEAPDVIHASSACDSCLGVAIALSWYHNVPCVLRPAWHFGKFDADYWMPIFDRADKIIAATKFERDFYSHHGISENKVETIGYGIDYDELSRSDIKPDLSSEERFTVLILSSRLSRGKGVPQSLAAAKRLPDVEFLIAGPEDDLRDKELPNNCQMLGFVSEEEKPRVYQSADVFLLPSVDESFGIVYLEALSTGIPVITADIPVCRELYSDVGLQIDPENVNEIVGALNTLRDDQELYKRFSRQAQRKAKDYDWTNVIDATEQLFKDTLK